MEVCTAAPHELIVTDARSAQNALGPVAEVVEGWPHFGVTIGGKEVGPHMFDVGHTRTDLHRQALMAGGVGKLGVHEHRLLF